MAFRGFKLKVGGLVDNPIEPSVEELRALGKGEGGKNEDDEYFDILPNI